MGWIDLIHATIVCLFLSWQLSHAQNAMVGQAAFAHVDQFVVAVRIGGKEKESRVDQIAEGVKDDALHNFAIEKLQPHPDAMDDGRAGMKVEFLMIRVAFKAVDVEDSLDF